MKKLILYLLLLFSLNTYAQSQVIPDTSVSQSQVQMADGMRSNGKIYVVVLVVAAVFTGLLVYTVLIDRKVSRLEKEIEDFEKQNPDKA